MNSENRARGTTFTSKQKKNNILKKTKKISILLTLCFLFFNIINAQSINEPRQCYSQEISRELQTQPAPFHKKTPEPIYEHTKDAILVIPVVIHIIHLNGEENLAEHYIYDQIEVLNEDFGKKTGTPGYNEHPSGADTKIRFILAQFDPDGNPVSGINRIESVHTDMIMELGDEMKLKNLIRWDTERYLNIWVVRSISGSGTLGYAYLPGNAAGREMDGIVIDYRVFGRNKPLGPNPTRFDYLYNGGRVLTHEAGHYLNLMHTWGGYDGDGSCFDDDKVHDTPNCEDQYHSFEDEGCPVPFQCGNWRMIENYMDYSSDGCMNIFTRGQRERMRIAIRNFRGTLVSYENLIRTGLDDHFVALNENEFNTIDVFPNPWFRNSENPLYIYALLREETELEISIYNMTGQKIATKRAGISNGRISFTPEISPGLYILLVKTTDETYTFKLRVF